MFVTPKFSIMHRYPEGDMLRECFGNGPFIYRLNENGSGPSLLNQVCVERGWKEYNNEGEQWNLWWKTTSFSVGNTKTLAAYQFINHIPKGAAICRKDNLVRYLRCMKSIYGSIYDFSPTGYNLPLEYTKLAADCNKRGVEPIMRRSKEDCPIWICKPVSKSQGKGIFLFRKLSELSYDSNTIVQKYIETPLLIGGYKFDLRLYVCIPSYNPITIYMYREGLARFGTDKFNLRDLTNPFGHLTNSSINKLGPNYGEQKDRIGAGCKWTLKQLRRYFQQAKIRDWLLWQRISALVTLTIISHATQVPQSSNCFDFFGFDVLIDETLKPWLLEVNLSPALSNDCDADREVKKPLLHDMFDLMGLPLYNTGLSFFDIFERDTFEDGKIDLLSNSSMPVDYHERGEGEDEYERWKKRRKRKNSRSSKSDTYQKSSTIKSVKGRYENNSKLLNMKKSFKIHRQDIVLDGKKLRDDEWKKARGKIWGNGKDWNTPKSFEGDWVRLWPFTIEPVPRGPTVYEPLATLKHIVTQVAKYSKVSRDLEKRYPSASESLLNALLQREMKMNGEIWNPLV